MFKVMFRYILLVLLINIVGCNSLRMGENVVLITGKVSGECQLSLKTEEASQLNSINVRSVSGSFSSDFVIDPNEQTYIVDVTCNNQLVLSRLVNYPSELSKFELGNIK